VLDYVTFRSLDRVRTAMFGSREKPDRKIPGREKASRLGEAGRLHLHQCVAQFRSDLAPGTVAVLREYFGPSFQEAAVTMLRAGLTSYRPELAKRQAELEAERSQLLALCNPLRKVASSAIDLQQKLHALRNQFDRAEKDVVLEPQPPGKPAAPADSRRAERKAPKS